MREKSMFFSEKWVYYYLKIRIKNTIITNFIFFFLFKDYKIGKKI